MKAFQINIGQRGAPRLSFGCMARSSVEAVQQHSDLAEEGERVEAVPVGRESLPVLAARNELATAELRAVAADLAEDRRKGERRRAVSDACAMELQVERL